MSLFSSANMHETYTDEAQLDKMLDSEGTVTVTVKVPASLSNLMAGNFEEALDAISANVVDCPGFSLEDFTYRLVGVADEDTAILEVTGLIIKH